MTVINRDHYLKQLVKSQFNGRVKVITGIRRCGKSFLLSTIYRAHLLKSGVSNDCIIDIDLEKREHASLRNPELLYDTCCSMWRPLKSTMYSSMKYSFPIV